MPNFFDRRQAMYGLLMACVAVALAYLMVESMLARYDRDETLLPALELLEDNRRIMEGVKALPRLDSPEGLLAYYLQRIREDGVPKHSALRQQIDAIVDNNTAVVTLLSKYAPRARHAEFRVVAAQYYNYAAEFRDRWQSVFELFMAGGTLPAAQPIPPQHLDAAIRLELRDR